MSDVLPKLFGSPARVKLMRFFLLNSEVAYPFSLLVSRTKITKSAARRELNLLSGIHFVSSKKMRGPDKKWVRGFTLNQKFSYASPLKYLLVNIGRFTDHQIVERLRKGGRIKIIIVAGIFLNRGDSRLDILIVGDSLKRRFLETALRKMEVEIGRELDYAILDTGEFRYRREVYDKFIRDVLDYPHRKVLDKFGLD